MRSVIVLAFAAALAATSFAQPLSSPFPASDPVPGIGSVPKMPRTSLNPGDVPIGISSIETNTPAGIATSATASFQADSLPVFLLCPNGNSNPVDSCAPNTFIKRLGKPGELENMSCLRPAPDGNLYLGGHKGRHIAISKMTPQGVFLWTRTLFEPANEQIFLAEFIVDSEGMIVGMAENGVNASLRGLVFRYNPVSDQLLWAHRLTDISPRSSGIIEKSPGGNFLLCQNSNFPNLQRNGEILELNRATGLIVPAYAKRYYQNWRQAFSSVVAQGDSLYIVGATDSSHVDVGFLVQRMTLSKINAATGDVVWTKSGHTDWEQPSHFKGIDVIVDGSSLVSVYFGNETDWSSGPRRYLFMQKSTLNGDVVWVKRYHFPGWLPKEVVAVPDGYIILVDDLNRYLLKTDKQGNLMKAKMLVNPQVDGPHTEVQNQMQVMDGYLYVADYAADSVGDLHTTLLKTDLNLDIEFSCDNYVSVQVQDSTVISPVNLPGQQTVLPSPTAQQPATAALAAAGMIVRETCPVCPNPPCTDKPDLAVQLESIGCDSAAFAHYRVCNTGAQPFSGTLNVGVYDANPLTSAAVLLDFLALTIDKLPPDSCQTGTLSNLVYWGNRTKVYTLAGIKSGQTTPIDPAGFPYNGIAECDYANNLDSLGFQYPPAPTLLTIEFYPGDTITLNGIAYTHSDTATITLSTTGGCDSVVTYILKRVVTHIDLMCPPDLTASIPANSPSVPVSYALPSAATDCPDPGIVLTRLSGPPPGGLFTLGNTPVCYEAANQCGIRDTCCFTVTAQQAVAEDACDVKIPPGSCIRYELLNIRLDAGGNPRYRIRLTNTCASPLKFAYFQLPDGITADAPANGAIYTAPGGNSYKVRNPNPGPFHSIRFEPLTGDVQNGENDIFEYTLPKQAQPLFILASVRLKDGTSTEAHLNTFSCPVQPYVAPPPVPMNVQNRNEPAHDPAIRVQPNPTTGSLLVNLHKANNEPVLLSVLNGQGQLVVNGFYPPDNGQIGLQLPEGLANGIYFLRVLPPGSDPAAVRFVLVR